MKVEIAESHGEAAIICYAGVDEIRVDHKEPKLDDEGKPLDEFDVLVALLNAASAEVSAVPRPEQPPLEGETQSERTAREKRNREAFEEYETKRREKAERRSHKKNN